MIRRRPAFRSATACCIRRRVRCHRSRCNWRMAVFRSERPENRWWLVFIGLPLSGHLPDDAAGALRCRKLWADVDTTIRPRILFVSVDPERDTAATEYVHYFSPDALAATSTHGADALRAQLRAGLHAGAAGWRWLHGRSLGSIAIVNPQGQQVGLVRPPLDPKRLPTICALINQGH